MPHPKFIDDEAQRDNFRAAVELLGGQRATARLLEVNETTVRDLVNGRRKLHDGFLRSTSRLLLAHADEARAVERRISPAFSANLTAEQAAAAAGKPDGRRFDQRRTVRIKDPAARCQACGRTVERGHTAECRNRAEEWPTIDAELADMDWGD